MGIRVALNTLRTIAAGSGSLCHEGEGLVGHCIEDGQKTISVSQKRIFTFPINRC